MPTTKTPAKGYTNERVSDVVYGSPATAEFTPIDWLDLAMASLDQAGLSQQDQLLVGAQLRKKLGL